MDITYRVPPQQVTNVTQVFNEPTPVGASWDWQGTSGDCESGKFVTNSPTADGTSMIQISGVNVMGSPADYIKAVSGFIQFVNVLGETVTFAIASIVPDEEGCIHVGVASRSGDLTWGGCYVVTFLPGT